MRIAIPRNLSTYPHWRHKSKENCIWFDFAGGTWFVGLTLELGLSRGWIQGSYGEDDWPSNISKDWKYDDRTKWCVAESGDVVFEDLSNGNFQI